MNKCPESTLEYYDNLYRTMMQAGNFTPAGQNYCYGFEEYPEASLQAYTTALIGDHKLSVGMLLNSIKPYKPHGDYDKPNNIGEPYLAVLIPLETKNTHTIVFNEHASSDEEFNALPAIDPLPDQELWAKYLDNCDQTKYPGITIKSIHKWNRGEPIIWHRLEIHSSDNFLREYEDKKAIVLFTEK